MTLVPTNGATAPPTVSPDLDKRFERWRLAPWAELDQARLGFVAKGRKADATIDFKPLTIEELEEFAYICAQLRLRRSDNAPAPAKPKVRRGGPIADDLI
jgi:hypothetical protein